MKCPLLVISFFKTRVVRFSTTKGMVGREDVRGEKVWVSGLNSGESVLAPFCVRAGTGPQCDRQYGRGWLVPFSSVFTLKILLLMTFLLIGTWRILM